MPSSGLEVHLTHYPKYLYILCDHAVYYDPTGITQPGLDMVCVGAGECKEGTEAMPLE